MKKATQEQVNKLLAKERLRIKKDLEASRKKGSNPKDIQGERKPPLHLIPLNAKIAFAMAMKNGSPKYGPYNWRELEILASAYIGAAQRHIDLWWDCHEENAKDSGVHHLGHAMATLGILYDALVNEQMIDDRPKPSKASELMDSHTVDNKQSEGLSEKIKSSKIVRRNIIDKDDPRVIDIEVPPFKPDRNDMIKEAMKRCDTLEVEGDWKRRLFKRLIVKKLDETFGVDLDWMAPEERRRALKIIDLMDRAVERILGEILK